ncbi:MAG: serine/threonine protein kinase [Planctomycetaceae bacterium]|nr:serine/threonine protein kinase [Planctomycetaceae bacterium]
MTESQILNFARQLTGSERDEFLLAICGSDNDLLQRIDRQLRIDSKATAVEDSRTVLMIPQTDQPASSDMKQIASSNEVSARMSDADDHYSIRKTDPNQTEVSDKIAAPAPVTGTEQLLAGQWIGSYRLVQRLGRGGMGDVWRAEQVEPVRREVALKVIKAGINSNQVLARFAAERQALALMNHPFIAKILDAGATAEGQPYFAMELVTGPSLTTFCDQNELSIEDRLKLFVDVCRGVQHAHQKGIIHRDLKPGNILVTTQDGRPVPKIIDFGLFKAFGEEAKMQELSLETNVGQILGTLKYMSPEQASLETTDVDTRTDIYALGVILYELLTGSTPLDDPSIKGQAAIKILEFIRERDPVKPSSKLSSSTDEQRSNIIRRRRTDSGRLSKLLIGDLDWIVMKALEKERSRRYDSAAGFAEDVERFLKSEPIVARPPSLFYRVNKFARKNRVAVTAGLLLLASLVVGIIGTSWGLREAIVARDSETAARQAETIAKEKESNLRVLAEQRQRQAEAATAQELAAKLKAEHRSSQIESINNAVFEIFTDFDLEQAKADEEPVEAVLGKRLAEMGQRLDESAIEDPIVLANLWARLGQTLVSLGLSQQAVEYLEKSLKLRQEQLGDRHDLTLASRSNLAAAFRAFGQIEQALPLYELVWQQRAEVHGEDDPATLSSLSELALGHGSAGDYPKAISLLETVLEKRKQILGEDHLDTLATMRDLGTGYLTAGQSQRALDQLVIVYEKLGLRAKHVDLEKVPLDQVGLINSLAAAYEKSGQVNQAIPLFEQAWQIHRRRLGQDHSTTLVSLHNLAYGYQAVGQLQKSMGRLLEYVRLARDKYGEKHPDTLRGKASLGATYAQVGNHAKAIPLLEEVLTDYRERLGNDHPDTMSVIGNLGAAYRAANRHVDALPLFEEAYKGQREKLGEDNPNTINSLSNLAAAYLTAGRMDEAVQMFEQGLEQRRRLLGEKHPMTLVSLGNLGNVYVRAGKIEQAIPLLEEVLETLTRQLGAKHPEVNKRAAILAAQYRDLAQFDKAIPLMQNVLDWREKELGAEHLETLSMMNSLAAGYWSNRQLDQSVPLLEEALKRMEESLGRADATTQATVANLGVNYRDVARLDEALPLLKEAYQTSLQVPSLSWVGPQLLLAQVQAGKTTEASELAKQLLEAARANNEAQSLALANQLLAISRATILIEGFEATLANLEESVAILQAQRPNDWMHFDAMSLLGQAKLKRDDMMAAESLLEQGFAGLQEQLHRVPPIRRSALPRTAKQLIDLYQRLERPEQVAKWQTTFESLRELE